MNREELITELRRFQAEADEAQMDLEQYLGTHPEKAAELQGLLREQSAACEELAARADNRDLPYAQRVRAEKLLAQLRLLGHPSLGAALHAVKQSASAAIAAAVVAAIATLLMAAA